MTNFFKGKKMSKKHNEQLIKALLALALIGAPALVSAASVEWIGDTVVDTAKLPAVSSAAVVKAVESAKMTAEKTASLVKAWRDIGYRVSSDDGLLSKTLNRWCAATPQSCALVKYQATDDIRIEASADFGKDFTSALSDVFSSINNHTIESHFSYRLTKNGVLIITSDKN